MPEGLKKTRLKTFSDYAGHDPDLPETHGCEHLIEYLFRLRPSRSGGFGAVNLSFVEIDAWARRVKIPLTGWEVETLYSMSEAYTGQMSISSKKTCPAPWSNLVEKTEAQKATIDDELLKNFERLAEKTKSTKKRRKPRATPAPKRKPKI